MVRPDGAPGEGLSRQGARRPYVTVEKGFGPGLTHRQRTASGRRYRARTGRGWGRMLEIMSKTGMSMREFVEQLSDEELHRGRLRDHTGGFRGRPPTWVPSEFHQACMRELLSRGASLYRENYLGAIRTMTAIAQDGRVKPADRIKAAQFVIERLEGKVPERLEITTEQPWQAIIADIVADVSDEQLGAARKALAAANDSEDEIVDAEVIEEDHTPAPSVPRRRRASSTVRRRRESGERGV